MYISYYNTNTNTMIILRIQIIGNSNTYIRTTMIDDYSSD